MLHFLALVGVLCISFSAVFIRLARVSPVTATFFRMIYALPVLVPAWFIVRRADTRTRAARGLAIVSGLLLALDLDLWHASIAFIGAGLSTVVANVQVVFVALAAWALYRERPTMRTIGIIGVVLIGVALTSGLARKDAYGDNPAAGAVLALLAGLTYAAYLLVFRQSNRELAPTAGPLLDTTAGAAIGALMFSPFDPRFSFRIVWPAHLWLALLAIGSQVVGWWFISAALPRLPAVETSIMLLGQPVGAIVWGVLLFDERLSSLQWAGAGLVVGGVGLLMKERSAKVAAVENV